MKYTIPCGHEANGVSRSVSVDDFHPLSRDEVRSLLLDAHAFAKAEHVREFSDIQSRLVQAVPGAKCPHEIEGEVALRQAQIDSLFVHTADLDVTDALIDLFCSLIATCAKPETSVT